MLIIARLRVSCMSIDFLILLILLFFQFNNSKYPADALIGCLPSTFESEAAQIAEIQKLTDENDAAGRRLQKARDDAGLSCCFLLYCFAYIHILTAYFAPGHIFINFGQNRVGYTGNFRFHRHFNFTYTIFDYY